MVPTLSDLTHQGIVFHHLWWLENQLDALLAVRLIVEHPCQVAGTVHMFMYEIALVHGGHP